MIHWVPVQIKRVHRILKYCKYITCHDEFKIEAKTCMRDLYEWRVWDLKS